MRRRWPLLYTARRFSVNPDFNRATSHRARVASGGAASAAPMRFAFHYEINSMK